MFLINNKKNCNSKYFFAVLTHRLLGTYVHTHKLAPPPLAEIVADQGRYSCTYVDWYACTWLCMFIHTYESCRLFERKFF
jgi:hypothetical protein